MSQAKQTSMNDENKENVPTIAIIIGMAGSGKTTLMQRINAHIHQYKLPSYIINLDPAVYSIPYSPNIDIRDTINYKNVMKQYKLGPNGGILTSLNLFSTKFDQVINLIDKRSSQLEYVFIDTPGQIEVFTWSASGQIITETLAATYPTILIYVIDTPRCQDPITFMSNMTYACSILYKTKLPFLLSIYYIYILSLLHLSLHLLLLLLLFRIVFNKIDIQSHLFAINWMKSLDDFEESLKSNQTYMSTLIKSLGSVLDAFYKNIKTVGVSAVTGQGMTTMFKQIEKCKQDYYKEYKPMIIKKIKERKLMEQEEKKKQLEKIEKDAMNENKKTIYKQETKEEQIEKLMNMGLNDDNDDNQDNNDHDDDGQNDQIQEIGDNQDEILKFLSQK